ncbi:HAAS signaling domain-containing protein [Frigoriglobus tundricola]|uniref:Uncharacterized protein n=1 Tax=Frigoriglobus tundricola TaxID=2774151 RepID=A0A6M5Z2E5_9BACT|nr:hypothetical protein [Frigoriglobus tundricola]QJW99896.1 hypothetical protein FTUN_7519 [Frigoriglobus tundricola]
MDRRQWLERVANELAGRGVPAGVRARLMEELRDHLDDLMEGGVNVATESDVSRLMGTPEGLADASVGVTRPATWVRRHPLVVFGLAPVPVAILGVAVYLLAAWAVGSAVAAGYDCEISEIPRGVLIPTATAFAYSIGFVPFLPLVAAFGWLGVRCRAGAWWLAAAVAQVALLAGAATTELHESDLPGASQLVVGLGLPLTGWRQVVQLLITVLIGGAYLRAISRTDRVPGAPAPQPGA